MKPRDQIELALLPDAALVTTQEVARMLAMSVSTVRMLETRGALVRCAMPGHPRYRKSDVVALGRSRRPVTAETSLLLMMDRVMQRAAPGE